MDGTITEPSAPTLTVTTAGNTPQRTTLPPDPTPIYSLTPSLEEWHHRDAMAYALLVLNVKNPVGLGLKVDGTVHEAMKSL
ncbi:hypothetical protein B0H17DRAFT_1225849, partial [Mycena rosella]